MSELRLNLITREWVIIATERAKKPEEFRKLKNKKNLPEYLDSCPFCPGNEQRTPDEIMRIPYGDSWKIRVTPNKFSALSPDLNRERKNEGGRHTITGFGKHEVIIESPVHNMSIAGMPVDDIADLIRTYRERFEAIYSEPGIEHVIIFKNYGEGAGTSLLHPHSQIIGTPVTPLQVRNRIEEGMRYFDNTGGCLMCSCLNDEISDGRRIIQNTGNFVTFVPFAAISPFHTWIFPKRHCATFSSITEEEVNDLAWHLKTILRKFYAGLEDPDFNYVIRSENPKECKSEYFHWYISIVPRITQTAGFELGSGMYINTSIPEESAEFLRKIKT
ncbi:MAG: galactose-1-phosphate uridylyltransferase [Thermodesulfovibrionales bacterium]